MDFNPLDLLAAAALSDKGSSSDAKGSESYRENISDKESSTESKDADDDKSDNMGKTKSSSVKQPVTLSPLKVSCEMSPQKISWSPEAFLSYLDKPSLDHEKLLIEELSPSFVKEKIMCLKECAEGGENEETAKTKNGNIQYDSIKIKNELSSCDVKSEDIPSPCADFLRKDGDDSVDVKDIKKDEPLSPVHENKERISHDVKLETFENGGQSDTDTAETSDSKTIADELPEMSCQEIVSLDHPYCLIPGQLCRLPSMDTLNEDIDVCSDNSPLSEDSEQRSRNFSLDCNYLKSGILEGKSAEIPQLHQAPIHRNLVSPLKSPAGFESMLKSKTGDTSAFKQVSVLSAERPGPSYGKFKIGTFASFSSSNLELEKYLRGLDSPADKKIDSSSSDNDSSNRVLHSPIYSPSVQPLLQSPSLDWDRSEAGSETQDDSSDARTPHRLSPDFTMERMSEWSHPMYHDHDYCAKSQPKPVSEDIVKLPLKKRTYTKKNNKLDSVSHERIMKAKYLKKELLKDSFLKSTPNHSPEAPPTVNDPGIKTNPVGRPRKRPMEKTIEEEIDPETGAKMKITGKFQDQYVYYLSKSRTTSRRRQTPTLPLFSDKIIVPAPKPGDIIVPHLTDADIEIVRTKGRSALNIPERPLMPSCMSSVPPKSSIPTSLPISQSNDLMSDVDSHIVSTILSMESDNLASPSSSQSQDLTHNSDLYNDQTSMNGDSNITSEQVLNYLLSVVKEEEPSLLQSSSSLFPTLPPDPLYTKAGHLADSLAVNHSPCSPNHKLEGIHSEILSSQSPLENHSFENSVKSEAEESVSLPDDLSSFISHSQVTTISNSTPEIDSQSSIKSEFSSDLSPLSTPNLTSSGLRLTSIEKTLDYLGVKDGEIKLEPNDPFTSKIDSDDMSSPLSLSNSVIHHNDDTPWIVTVTLYFNDVPAIMIINEPYIRLVDIHKQILPAKDTGILKKRCQLLNIPVLNCTEMHRYFLVQYGKAYNSKSTLIISKDQATALVTYYATPQPRLGRAEDAHMRRYSCGDMSPVPVDAISSAPVKKRGYKSNRKGAQTAGLASRDVGVTDVKAVSPDALPVADGLNKRTRHKKVNYLEMLRGEEKEKATDDSILETIESVLKSSTDHPVLNPKLSKEKYSVTSKSLSKKKVGRSQSCDKKIRDNNNHRRKSVESKKKGKGGGGKLFKSSKPKGSTSNLGKKQDKLVRKEGEACSNIDMEFGECSLKSNKFRPLKLKVNSLLNFTSQRRQSSSSILSSPSKKGLFSRSNSSTSSTLADRPMRVLAVAHQAALSKEEGDSHLPSQPADIHLDLFTKSSSACVCCHTCSQFLSVPHFMKHHHVAMDNEWLATEAAHRILVPRNKENISEEERSLWEEFHRLQEAIGGFGEADDDSDSDGDADEDTDFDGNGGQSSLETSGASYLSMDTSHDHIDLSYHEPHLAQSSHINPTDNDRDKQASLHSHVTTHQSLDRDFTNRKTELFFKGQLASLPPVSNSSVLTHSRDSPSHVRTSSRRRKSKQLFSIENYCTPTKKGMDEEGNSFLSSVSGTGGV